jgi:WD40 repeat protein
VPVDGEAEPPGSVPTQSMGTRFRLWGVPDIPPHFLNRTDELEGLRQKVLGDAGSVGIFGLQGMGGIGKTVLANALARDPQVQARFPDGVYWVTVGIEPMLTRQQGRLAEAVSGTKQSITDVQQGKDCLRQCFAGKQAMLILDDLWNAADAKAFAALDGGSRLLLTTRDREILTVLGADEHTLGLLAEPQALELLAEWSGRTLDDLGEDGRRVAEECGYLPLALSITGAMLKGQPDKRWGNVLKRLQNADLDKIKRQFPDYPYPDLLKALQVSVDALEPDLQDRYLDLAVFPEDTPIPETVIETFWEPEGLDDLDTDEILAALADKSLLQRGEDGVLLHDLQYDYITKQVADLPTLHQRLLDAYAEKCDDGWPSGPNDGYYFQQLAYHFAGAKREPELQELLLNFDWLQAKLAATEVNSLINDYDHLPDDPDLTLVQVTLRLSAHVLAREPGQLRERLWGHLQAKSRPAIKALLQQAIPPNTPWLCPQQANLTPPDGPLLRTLEGHSAWVLSVAISPDGSRAVSASSDHTLKVWDLERGVELNTLESSGWSVAISPDGQRAVSESDDGTLKVWDLERGVELNTLAGHSASVRSVAISPDGQRAVSASSDGTLKVWDLERGVELNTLAGHSDSVLSVAISPDGQRAVSASLDRTLKVWDLERGVELNTLAGHSDSVLSVAISPDGQRAVSASLDRTLKVWDLERGVELNTLAGHSGAVRSVAISPARGASPEELGQRAVSASDDGTLKVWDLERGVELNTLAGHSDSVRSVAISPDGQRAVSASSDGTLKVWDLERGVKLNRLAGHSASVRSVAISPDGQQAVSASSDGTLKVWDLERGVKLNTLDHSDAVRQVAISPDGQQAVSISSDDGTLKVWDLERGVELNPLDNILWVGSLAISPAREASSTELVQRQVSVSDDGTLKVWDLDRGVEFNTLEGHSDWVNSVAISRDGQRAVSASSDRTLKVWDLATGRCIATFWGDSPFLTCAVAPDGVSIVAGDQAGGVHFFRLEGVEVP